MPGFTMSDMLRRLRHMLDDRRAHGQTDADLLKRFTAEVDETAFATLVERHGAMVLNVCRRILQDEHLTEDAFQATFLVLAQRAGSIGRPDALAGWLHGVALRLSHKCLAQSKRGLREERRETVITAADPQAEVSWREMQGILDEELQGLPEKYRLPLVLCWLEGRTRDEAATQLGWTIGKLKGLLERGRERLRCRLNKRGVTLSATTATAILCEPAWSAMVPPLLAASTVRAGSGIAAGKSLATCGVSSSVVVFTQGGISMLASNKLGFLVAVVVAFIALGTGIAFYALGAQDPGPADVRPDLQAGQDGAPPKAEPAPEPVAQDKKPAGKGIAAETVAAYEDLEAEYGGWEKRPVTSEDWNAFRVGREHAEKGFPGFRLKVFPEHKLPNVAVPFGLSLAKSGLKNSGLKDLIYLENLSALSLAGTDVSNAGLRELPSLKNLVVLDLSNTKLTNVGLIDLANLPNLAVLDLSGTKVTNAKRLAALKKLTALDLGGTEVTDTEALAPLQLTRLSLRSVKLTDAQLNGLAALKSLESLDLAHTAITDVRPLPALDNLSSLNLSWTGVIDVRPLASLKKLTRLNLSALNQGFYNFAQKETGMKNRMVMEAGLKELALSLKNLESLELRQTPLTDIAPLASLANLSSLDMNGVGVTDIRPLASLPKLAKLSLGGNDVPVKTLKELARLNNLTSLDVRGVPVTDHGLIELSRLKNLTSLSVFCSDATDEGLMELASLRKLTTLKVGHYARDSFLGKKNKITPAGIAALQKEMPNCAIAATR